MRRFSVLFVVPAALCVFVWACVTSAATAETTYQKICQGHTGNPSDMHQFSLGTTADEMRAYLQQRVICPSACYDVHISLSVVGLSLQMVTTATNKCTSPQPPATSVKNVYTALPAPNVLRNCSGSKGPASVTLKSTTIPTKLSTAVSVGPKSRCDPTVISAISAFSNGNIQAGLNTLASVQNPSVATEDLSAKQAFVPLTGGSSVTTDELAKQLAAGTGISQSQAADIVAKNPSAAQDAINAIAQGDQAAIQTSMKALNLNPDLANTSSLQAEIAQSKDTPAVTPDQGPQGGVTGLGDNPPQGADITGPASDFCQQMSGGCGNACAQSNVMACRYNNPGNLTCGPIAYQYGAAGCDAAHNNTAIFPTVEQGTGAMAALLTGPGYFGGQNNTLYSAICKYAPNSDGNNCQAYATYVAGQIGISPMQTIDPQDSTTMAKVMIAMSRYESGAGAIFTPQQLQTGLQYAYDTQALPTGTQGFVPQLVPGGVPQSGYYSPFALGYGGTSYPGPVSTGYPVSTGGYVSTGGTVPTESGTPVIQQIPQITGTVSGTGTTGGVLPPAPALVPPVATLVVQPQQALLNSPVSVAWSSVGMRTDRQCAVFVQSGNTPVQLASGNEGTTTVKASPSGTLAFTLQCFARTGIQITKNASVIVQ